MLMTTARVLGFTVLGVAPLFLVSVEFAFLSELYGVRRDHLGLAVSCYFIVAAASTVVLRRRIDGVGPERGLRIAAAMSAAATLVAAALIRGPTTLVLVLACAGSANAMAQISANVAVATRVSSQRRALGFGIKQSAIPVASLSVSLLAPWAAQISGWRIPFVATALAAALAALIGPRLAPPPRADAHPGSDLRRIRPSRVSSPTRTLALLALANGLGSAAGNAAAVFAVDAGVTVAGLSIGRASLLLAAGSAVSVLVRVGSGWLVDRTGGDPVPMLRIVLAPGVFGFAALVLGGNSPLIFAMGSILALGAGWGFPGLTHYASTRLTNLPPGQSTSPVLTAGYLGPVIVPTIVGLIAQRHSYQAAWVMLGLMVLAATACVALLPRAVADEALTDP